MANDGSGIGTSLLRKEDERHLQGRGEFVSDIKLPGMMDVAFVRSPHAHARIRSISVPPEARGRVFTAADLPRIKPIRITVHGAGAKAPAWPPLAIDKARYVGEAIAACIAPSRGEAEDLANTVAVDFEALDAVVDAPRDMHGSRHPVHDQWGDNLYVERVVEGGDIEAAARAAEITITREFRMQRQSGAPLEGRAVLAYRDHRLDEVVVYASTQTPHTVRYALGEFLDIEARRIRVVAPDVGGGFGPKARLYPEEIILAALALGLDHPVRWVEDRGEHLLTSAHTRGRCRDRRRRRRLWAVAAGAVSRGGDGGAQPAGAIHNRQLPGPALHGGDQQDAARPLSWGRPSGGVLCDRADGRRGRPCGRARPGRGARREHGAVGAAAVHHGRRHAARQWRLSAKRASLRRAARPARDSRAPAERRARRAPRWHRLCRLCRADRAWCR